MKPIDLSKWIVPDLSPKYPGSHIEQFIIDKIKNHEIQPGEEMPSCRVMAEVNSTNKNTVHEAYTRLGYRGWLSTVPGGRTYVGDSPPFNDHIHEPILAEPEFLPLDPTMIQALNDSVPQSYVSIGPPTLNENYILEERIAKHARQYIRDISEATQAQKLMDQRGEALKEAIYDYLHSVRLVALKPEQLLVIHGHFWAIELICKLILTNGAVVINAAGSDLNIQQAIALHAKLILDIDPSEHNFLETLEELLTSHEVKLMLIRPGCVFPEGHQMKPEACMRLIELAIKHQFFILEDDDEHEFRTTPQPYKLLWNYPHQGLVIYCGALSRLNSYLQNIRTVFASERIVAWLANLRGSGTVYRNQAKDLAVTRMLSNGELAAFVRNTRERKLADMHDMYKILMQHLGAYLAFELPESGLTVWLEFNPAININKQLKLLSAKGIEVPYHPTNQRLTNHVHHMRLDISHFERKECLQAAIELQKIFRRIVGF